VNDFDKCNLTAEAVTIKIVAAYKKTITPDPTAHPIHPMIVPTCSVVGGKISLHNIFIDKSDYKPHSHP
jgi:hypothetical protein